jgi:membrane associated rhomboid family serine protease
LITRLLIVLNVIGFLWEMYVGGTGVIGGSIPANSRVYDGMLAPVTVTQYHQYYRIFTSAFLHGSIIHIGVNMLSLYWLGRFIEVVLGSPRMLVVYIASLLGSAMAIIWFSPPDAATLGASGAIFGLFGALFAIGLKLGERGGELVRSNIGILIINLVYSFAFPGISWQAHIGGLITGFLLTLVLFWPPKPVRTRAYDPSTGAVYESQLEP